MNATAGDSPDGVSAARNSTRTVRAWRFRVVFRQPWRAYFYYHFAMAVLLGLFTLLDLRGIYPDHALANVPFALRAVLQGVLGFVLFQAVLLPLIAPLINLWFLGVSLQRTFAFGAMAMCDVIVTIAQWLALFVACQ